MVDRLEVERLLRERGYDDFLWLTGGEVSVRQWVRFKCLFGCPTYGHKAGCPPVVPPIAECREFFAEYRDVIALRLPVVVENAEDFEDWSREASRKLLELERAVFLAGYPKSFALFMGQCLLCSDCLGDPKACRHPDLARPSAEALGVDVFGTLQEAGFELEVLTEINRKMNRFAFLLVA